jgi:hypothetical protein
MTLVIGTNNSLTVTSASGTDWANVGVAVKNQTTGYGYGPYVGIWSGDDIEPDYSTPSPVSSWQAAYDNVSNHPLMYDYGSASGCPSSGMATCNNSWTQADLDYEAWGAPPSYPFPQIYATSGVNALQWEDINTTAGYIGFYLGGVLSQQLACEQLNNPSTCSGTNQGPVQAYTELEDATDQDPLWTGNIGYSQLTG